MKNLKITTLLAAMLLTATLFAQEKAVRSSAGYFDLTNIRSIFTEEPTLEINLEGFLLTMAASATKLAEPDLAEVLDSLMYVRVERYDLSRSKRTEVQGKNGELAKQLDKAGWERVVRVRENSDDVYVYLKQENRKIVGIVVMAIEGMESVLFANIVGNIDPEEIGRLGSRWDMNHLDSVRWEYRRRR